MAYRINLTEEDRAKAIADVEKQLNAKITRKIDITVNPSDVAVKPALILLSVTAYKKMIELISQCSKEVAWHAVTSKISTEEGTVYQIEDILLFPQTVTGATVTSDDEAYTKWVMGLDDDTFNHMRCHMHSHVNMGVSPSGVDTTYQQQVLQNIEDYYVFMIWNKSGKFWANIFDVEDNVVYEAKDIEVEVPDINEYTEWAAEQIELYVKEQKYTYANRADAYKNYQSDVVKRIEAQKKQEEYMDYFNHPTDYDADYDYYGYIR